MFYCNCNVVFSWYCIQSFLDTSFHSFFWIFLVPCFLMFYFILYIFMVFTFLYTSCTSALSWYFAFWYSISCSILHIFSFFMLFYGFFFILISLFNCLSFHFWIIMIFSIFSIQICLSLWWQSILFQWTFNGIPGIDSALALYLKVQRLWVSIVINFSYIIPMSAIYQILEVLYQN